MVRLSGRGEEDLTVRMRVHSRGRERRHREEGFGAETTAEKGEHWQPLPSGYTFSNRATLSTSKLLPLGPQANNEISPEMTTWVRERETTTCRP